MSARRVPTRLDLHRFWTREGWEQVPSTHHLTFELTTASGAVLRSSPSVARGLQRHLGLTGADLEGLSQEQAVAMLEQYWQDQAKPGQQDDGG